MPLLPAVVAHIAQRACVGNLNTYHICVLTLITTAHGTAPGDDETDRLHTERNIK
jgi:hypothetical protein